MWSVGPGTKPRSKTQSGTKHVESVSTLCPDAGSNPASSTILKPLRSRAGVAFLFIHIWICLWLPVMDIHIYHPVTAFIKNRVVYSSDDKSRTDESKA